MGVDSKGNLVERAAQGSKTFTHPAPTATASQVLAANPGRISATIVNNGAATVYLGKDATVTTATGLPLAANATLDDHDSTDAWYAVMASGTGDLRICEVS